MSAAAILGEAVMLHVAKRLVMLAHTGQPAEARRQYEAQCGPLSADERALFDRAIAAIAADFERAAR